MMKHLKTFYENKEEFELTKTIEEKFDFFHISTNKLGNQFVFTAKVPDNPFLDSNQDVIEDNFTKRVSLSQTIKGCLDAITDEDVDGYYIYGVKKENIITKYLFDLSSTKCPIGYNTDFTLRNWLGVNRIPGEYYSPSDLPVYAKSMFYGCVPDISITGEYWYLADLQMSYVGEVIPWKYGIDKIVI